MGQLRIDLTSGRWVRRFLGLRAFPVALQGLALAGMAGVAAIGWGIGGGLPEKSLLTLRKTNLATLVVWGLWWPAMIIIAVTLGRAWCTVCPAELANRLGDAVARRVGWRRAGAARWIRAGWLMVTGYLALQVAVAGHSIHRVPHYTSVMIIVLLAAAFAAGLIFRAPRSFCSTLCPVNPLLAVYGRFTPLQLDVADPALCASCQTKECIAQKNRYTLDGRSCPSLLRPFARRQGDGCVLCFQCVKVCPHANVGFGLVGKGAGSRAHRRLLPFEAAFVMIAAGFVTHELVGEVGWLEQRFHAPPAAIAAAVPGLGFGWAEAAWFLALFPLLIWSAAAAAARLLGQNGSLSGVLTAAATGAAPVIAVAHLSKAFAKLTSWASFLPLALADPRGLDTLDSLARGALAAPAPLVALDLVGWTVLATMLAVGWRSLRWTREAAGEGLTAARAGFAVTALGFSGVLLVWALG